MREKIVDAVRSAPYIMRLVGLVLIFNGMFALIKSATVLLGNDVQLDWRIANIIIGYGLLLKRRFWYFAAGISVIVSFFLHIKSMAMVYPIYGTGGIIYLAIALVIDLAMVYVLLHHQTLSIYFDLKDKQ